MNHTNRLARETSPYLLQHAHNPVDWYPWGPEAFAKARAQDKPVFLSVGYSTCYWCHVMERECFEDQAIAEEMNRLFINIKVDREQRPDVDQIYMTAVQVLTQHGGWPMSVWLTPELRPFYGGTYFPPADTHGRPGFITVMRAIDQAYRERRSEVNRSADQLVNILSQLAQPPLPSQPIRIDREFVDRLIDRSVEDYDPVHGGFGTAPKFPRQTLLEMLLTYLRIRSTRPNHDARGGDRDSRLLGMVRHSLDALANGGIRDHLGGGFHRYSTDAQWLVPHFEIMLYDNAMLGWCYAQACRQTGDARYARVARGIFDFILREMTSPDGAFYTAFDAEVDAAEGGCYLWTAREVREVLGEEEADLFTGVYGLDRGPNFADPHHGSGVPDKNVLYLPNGPELEDDPRIVKSRQRLYSARRKRKQPLLDTKIITSWNALMIRALALGGQVLQEPTYHAAARRAARFLLDRHRTKSAELCRTSRDGVAAQAGFLDDYALVCQALLALYDACGEQTWRHEAVAIAKSMKERFGGLVVENSSSGVVGSSFGGGFFFTPRDAEDLIVRQKIGTDSPLPSGNGVAAMVMQALDEPELSRQTIGAFARQLDQQGTAMSALVEATMMYLDGHEPFETGSSEQAAAQRLPSPDELARRIVSMTARWRDPTCLEVSLEILKPFHISAPEAQDSAGMIHTELRVAGAPVESIDYAPGQRRSLALSDKPVWVYDGQTDIVVRFTHPPTQRVRLSLVYQACDDSSCLAPATRELEIAPS